MANSPTQPRRILPIIARPPSSQLPSASAFCSPHTPTRLGCSRAQTESNIGQRVLCAWKQLAAQYSPLGGLEYAARVAELTNRDGEGVGLSASIVLTRLTWLRNRYEDVLSRSVEGSVPLGKEVEEFQHFERVQEIILASRTARRAALQQQRDHRSRDTIVLQNTLGGRTGARIMANAVQRGKGVGRAGRVSIPPLLLHGGRQVSDGGSGVLDGSRAETGATLASSERVQKASSQRRNGIVDHSIPHIAGRTVPVYPSAALQQKVTLNKSIVQASGPPRGLSACQGVTRTGLPPSVNVDRAVVKPFNMVAEELLQPSVGEFCGTTAVAQGGELSRSHTAKRRRVLEILSRPSGVDAIHAGNEEGRKKRMRKFIERANNTLVGNGKQNKRMVKEGDSVRPRHALRNSKGQFRTRTTEKASETASGSDVIGSYSEEGRLGDTEKEGIRRIGTKHIETCNRGKRGNYIGEDGQIRNDGYGNENANQGLSPCSRKIYMKTAYERHGHGESNESKMRQKSGAKGESFGGKLGGTGMNNTRNEVEVFQGTQLEGSRAMEVDGEQRSVNKMTRVQTLEPKFMTVGQITEMAATEELEDARRMTRAGTADTSGNALTKTGDRRVEADNQVGYNRMNKSAEILQYLKQVEEDTAEAEAEAEIEKVWRGMADTAGLRSADGGNDIYESGVEESEEMRRKKIDRDDERRWNHTKRLVEELRKSAVVMRKLGMTAQAEVCMKKVVELLDEEVLKSSPFGRKEQ